MAARAAAAAQLTTTGAVSCLDTRSRCADDARPPDAMSLRAAHAPHFFIALPRTKDELAGCKLAFSVKSLAAF